MNARIIKLAQARLPTAHGEFDSLAFRNVATGVEHLVLTLGELGGDEPVLARMHSECLTGDVFASQRCDCGEQLELALQAIQVAGRGVLIYLRGQEGRGIGLANKIRAYELQEIGMDTVDANLALDLPVDARSYQDAIDIFALLGITAVRLMSNNPAKVAALETAGIRVAQRLPHIVAPSAHNRRYLQTKQTRMGHALKLPARSRRAAEPV